MNEKLIEKQSNQLFVSVVGAYLRVNSSYYRPVYYSKCLINHLKVRLVKLSSFHKLKKKKKPHTPNFVRINKRNNVLFKNI